MNYFKIYNQLINKGLTRGFSKSSIGYYTESHHIIPRCMGGTDDSSNIVLLTGREHFIAHQLLFKIHRTPELIFAVHVMTASNQGQHRKSRLYEWIRKEHSKSISKIMIELWKDPEYRIKMVKSLYKRHLDYPVKSSTRDKISKSLLEFYSINKVSKEARLNNSIAQINRFKLHPQSVETKHARKLALRKKQGTPVDMVDENGVVIKSFSCASEAKEMLSMATASQNIYTACKRNMSTGRMYKSGGFYWKYTNAKVHV
ncbi:homing endonuclease [Yersinia phage MHG19]|nr:homing endonuclease [Yersinia phage MHG19]